MIGHLEHIFSKTLRWFSRSEWGIRLAGLSKSTGAESDPGLVMIQVDGLSQAQLEAALKKGKMPFLNRLIQQEGYRLHTHFPGVPTSTPAIQGELFYGVKRVVPATKQFRTFGGRQFLLEYLYWWCGGISFLPRYHWLGRLPETQ
jgi:hypothetical protein